MLYSYIISHTSPTQSDDEDQICWDQDESYIYLIIAHYIQSLRNHFLSLGLFWRAKQTLKLCYIWQDVRDRIRHELDISIVPIIVILPSIRKESDRNKNQKQSEKAHLTWFNNFTV